MSRLAWPTRDRGRILRAGRRHCRFYRKREKPLKFYTDPVSFSPDHATRTGLIADEEFKDFRNRPPCLQLGTQL
jgi:hypothetical protein